MAVRNASRFFQHSVSHSVTTHIEFVLIIFPCFILLRADFPHRSLNKDRDDSSEMASLSLFNLRCAFGVCFGSLSCCN